MFSLRFPRYRDLSFRCVFTILRIGIAGSNLVARLFSLLFSLVKARFWEPACEAWWVVLVNAFNFSLTFDKKGNASYIYTNNVRILPNYYNSRDDVRGNKCVFGPTQNYFSPIFVCV